MCLIILAHQIHPDYPLLLAANRDEFYNRPTQRMHWWPPYPEDGDASSELLAGKDLQAGGTWFGITDEGRWIAVTNVRNGNDSHPNDNLPLKSRGVLCTNFLRQKHSSIDYANSINPDQFAGYNLLLWDGTELVYVSNKLLSNNTVITPQILPSGIYGLSNASLNTPWPKLMHVKTELRQRANHEIDHHCLQRLMHHKQIADDHELPDTGIPYDWEKRLSACFISAPEIGYGTRTCTSVMRNHDNKYSILERGYDQAHNQDEWFEFTAQALS